jgi:NAD(P)-dependent dehydrogenase (short-subunit alcohol dehydrogenase family)
MSRPVALVTGAGSGIGAATATRFASAGYQVIGVDRSIPTSSTSTDTLWSYDVSRESDVRDMVAEAMDRFGRIDVLAHVAGVVVVRPIEETTWEDFRQVTDVNLGGTFLVTKYVVPVMKQQKAGAIVHVASVSGHIGQVDHALYGATKAGIIAMVRALAWELAPHGIRINSVSPGSVDTPMLRGDIATEATRLHLPYDEVKRMREQEQAFGRWADPREIAEAIWFLASEGASYVTGADLLVDCGWTAR